jgi:hypothetical protein
MWLAVCWCGAIQQMNKNGGLQNCLKLIHKDLKSENMK